MSEPATSNGHESTELQNVAIPVTQSNVPAVQGPDTTGAISAFASKANFANAQRMAVALASSSLVPSEYRGDAGLANCLVAIEMASRTGASVMAVMQNLYVINGRPSWSAQFLVSALNSSGRYSSLRYETKGNDDPFHASFACRAVAIDRSTGDRLEGEWITWQMVRGEGWDQKKGSKWKTMPGQMFRYRAASFFARVYAPEIALGMQTAEEVADYTVPGPTNAGSASTLNSAIRGEARVVTETPTAETQESRPPLSMESEDEQIMREAAESAEEERREREQGGR